MLSLTAHDLVTAGTEPFDVASASTPGMFAGLRYLPGLMPLQSEPAAAQSTPSTHANGRAAKYPTRCQLSVVSLSSPARANVAWASARTSDGGWEAARQDVAPCQSRLQGQRQREWMLHSGGKTPSATASSAYVEWHAVRFGLWN